MKHLKTKLGLSVLALACLGAGVVSLQPTVKASADAINMKKFVIINDGASVYLGDNFSGIRWKAGVYKTAFDTYCGATENWEIGVLVAPNVEEAELTIETQGVKKLPVDKSSLATKLSEGSATFYAVINFDDLDGVDPQDAYALELTARSYVQLDGVYYYSEMDNIDTTRSARQVAIAAELAGEIDEDYRDKGKTEEAEKAQTYYGMTEKYEPKEKLGSINSKVINMDTTEGAPNQTLTLTASDFTTTGTIEEVVIGTKKVDFKNGSVTISANDISALGAGEYYATAFTSEGVKTCPVIKATKVLTSIEDFEMFSYIRKNYSGTKIFASQIINGVDGAKCKLDGYYVLGNNIDASKNKDGVAYVQPTDSCTTWEGHDKFADKKYGLTGTFNGMGFAVSNMTLMNSASGIFELINGGTVKNFALYNLKSNIQNNSAQTSTGAFAYYARNPIIDNVYVHIDGTDGSYSMLKQYQMFTYYIDNNDKASFSNSYLDVQMAPTYVANSTGIRTGVFGEFVGKGENTTTINFKNVYSVSNVGLKYYVNSKNTLYHYGYGVNEKDTDNEDGYVFIAATNHATDSMTKHSSAYKSFEFTGTYHYTSTEAFAGKNHDLTAFKDSGCWDTTSGVPVWKSLQTQN